VAKNHAHHIITIIPVLRVKKKLPRFTVEVQFVSEPTLVFSGWKWSINFRGGSPFGGVNFIYIII
jgi:hypothetical protein